MNTDLEIPLRGSGLRVTTGRIAVLAALDDLPHSSAESLWRRVRGELPSISIQSVHNVLADLTAVGIIRRIEPAGFAARYERRIGDNHHHLVCSRCDAIADVDCVHGAAPCLTPNDASGYILRTAEVTFWGFCPDCQQAQSPQQEIKEIT